MLLAASKSLRFTPLAATEFLMGIAPLESCSALIARLLPQLESIYAEYHSAHRSGELSDMVKTYVREHISDPRLSLKWISEHVLYMNEDYVGRTAAVFRESATDSVILGREGWLFYSDTLADYQGTAPLSDRAVWAAAHVLALMQECAAETAEPSGCVS